MKDAILAKWNEILDILENEYGISHFMIHTWIEPLKVYSVEGDKVYFTLDEHFGLRGVEFLQKKFFNIYLETILKELFHNDSIQVVFTLESIMNKEEKSTTVSQDYMNTAYANNLHPDYTFENFIVGDGNKLAHAACVAVADSPGQDRFNPLFLYGESGLGKSHLMQAIAHYILQHNKDMKVLYVTSKAFTNDIVSAIEKRSTEEFREKYTTVDVLLIDDIQELIGKRSTQEEFFDTFNELHRRGKQIILSSDKPPKDIGNLEKRYRSRFEWGVPIDIQAPDYETRMAILKSKAELFGFKNISESIFEYIAGNITYSVRELESALKTLSLYSDLGQIKLTDEEAIKILENYITKDENVDITPDRIISAVSEHLNIPVEDIKSNKRSKEIAKARQISMYLCRKYTDKGLQSIGNYFGGKDHSTVHSNVQKVEKKLATDSEYSEPIDVIIKKLNLQK